MAQRHQVSKCCWKNGANRLTWPRVAAKLQFVKNSVSAKCAKVESNKTRYAWIYLVIFKQYRVLFYIFSAYVHLAYTHKNKWSIVLNSWEVFGYGWATDKVCLVFAFPHTGGLCWLLKVWSPWCVLNILASPGSWIEMQTLRPYSDLVSHAVLFSI